MLSYITISSLLLESEAAPRSYPVALSNTSTEKMVPLTLSTGAQTDFCL